MDDELQRLEQTLLERGRRLRESERQLTERELLLREWVRDPFVRSMAAAGGTAGSDEAEAPASGPVVAGHNAQQRALRAEAARAELQFRLDELQAQLLAQMRASQTASPSDAAAFVAADPNLAIEKQAAEQALIAERDGLRARLEECENAWRDRRAPAAAANVTAAMKPSETTPWRPSVQRAIDWLSEALPAASHKGGDQSSTG